MSYRVHTKNDSEHEVIEKGTELVITVKAARDEAMRTCRSLNLGSGFDGFTPPFFTLQYPNPDHAKGKAAQT